MEKVTIYTLYDEGVKYTFFLAEVLYLKDFPMNLLSMSCLSELCLSQDNLIFKAWELCQFLNKVLSFGTTRNF